MRDLAQRQGKELSFNNLLDIDAAMWAVALLEHPAGLRIIKHTTPCGIALGTTPQEAFERARAMRSRCRRSAAVVAFNTVVDARGGARDERTSSSRSSWRRRSTTRPCRSSPRRRTCASSSCRSARGTARSTSSGCAAASWCRTGSCSIPIETGVEGRHRAGAERPRVGRPALRLGRGRGGQVERDPAGPRRAGDRHRRRPDEPGGQRLPRGPQGAAGRARPAGSVLASDAFFPFADGVEQAAARRRHRDHPARRLGARRRSHRRGRPARHRDGDDRERRQFRH